eukprot:2158530-Rhodomonas_salina.1
MVCQHVALAARHSVCGKAIKLAVMANCDFCQMRNCRNDSNGKAVWYLRETGLPGRRLRWVPNAHRALFGSAQIQRAQRAVGRNQVQMQGCKRKKKGNSTCFLRERLQGHFHARYKVDACAWAGG